MSKIAGRLCDFKHEWKKLDPNSTVLPFVEGYKIPFRGIVRQIKPPKEQQFSKAEETKISQLIAELLTKGAIKQCHPVEDQFVSSIFTVPKSDGSSRLIFNLKDLNKFLDPVHFKMEDGRTVAKLLFKDCYMATIDIKDAYHHVPIDKEFRKFLRFRFKNKWYEYVCLPFGISTAPYVFTKLLKPLIKYLRQQGIIIVIYLDDILVIGKSYEGCLKDVELTQKWLIKLGFILNVKKSNLIPSKQCQFLGLIYDSENLCIRLPDGKQLKIKESVRKFKLGQSYKIREFAQTLGFLISCCPAVKYGFVYTKACERIKFLALDSNGGNYDSKLVISESAMEELRWWNQLGPTTCNPIRQPEYDVEIFSDASLTGWGAVCEEKRVHGHWTDDEKDLSINYKELSAAFFALKCFVKDRRKIQILMRIDNTTAISYINRMGGVQLENLSNLAKKIWQWCESRDLWIFASYIASEDNFEADEESRKLEPNTEFEISHEGFGKIVNVFGIPEIDLFATRSNAKCKKYVSWKKDPGSIAIDAFTISWKSKFFYAFPPVSVIIRVLNKIRHEGSEGIVVVPEWPSQPWYPIFTSLIISPVVRLKADDYVIFVDRETESCWKKVTLVAAVLSGKAL